MSVHAEYRLELQEYIAGARLARKHAPQRSWKSDLMLPFIGMLIDAVIITIYQLHGLRMSTFASGNCIVLLIVCFLPSLPYYKERSSINKFKKMDGSKPISVSFDEAGLTLVDTGRSEGRYTWPTILKMVKGDSVVLLFYSKACCWILPRRIFADEDWERMRGYVDAGRNMA
jgi:hypothetical protein